MSDLLKVLEIDVGNTQLKWRVVDQVGKTPIQRATTAAFLAGEVSATAFSGVSRVRVASVASDEINERLRLYLQAICPQVFFAQSVAHMYGLVNAYETPEKMGVDRWLGMLAAWQRQRSSLCVIDCGSAITIDWVDTHGLHLGGYIIPGLRMLQTSLLSNTARVKFNTQGFNWNDSPGSTTDACVKNGSCYVLSALAEKIQRQADEQKTQSIVVTGGDGHFLIDYLRTAQWEPELVMEGLVWADQFSGVGC